jgi:hypothetical protein
MENELTQSPHFLDFHKWNGSESLYISYNHETQAFKQFSYCSQFVREEPTLTLMLPNLQQNNLSYLKKQKCFFWFFPYINDHVTCLCDLYTHVIKTMLEQQHKP